MINNQINGRKPNKVLSKIDDIFMVVLIMQFVSQVIDTSDYHMSKLNLGFRHVKALLYLILKYGPNEPAIFSRQPSYIEGSNKIYNR